MTETYPELTETGWIEEGETEVRPDGFRLTRSGLVGWNISAPSGQLFAWGETMYVVGEKIDREKGERLWH